MRVLRSSICREFYAVGEQLGGDAAAEEAPPRSQSERPGAADDEAAPLERRQRVAVDGVVEPGRRERLVEPEAEQHALARLDVGVERLELARRPLAALERGQVARAGSARSATAAPPTVETAPTPIPR